VSFQTDRSPAKAHSDLTENLANLLIPTSYQHSWNYHGEFTLLVSFSSLPSCLFYLKSLEYVGADCLLAGKVKVLVP